MTFAPGRQAFMVLVDDDSHSARIMVRTLIACGAPAVTWLAADGAAAELAATLEDEAARMPDLVIVDLKSSSTATATFVAELRARCEDRHLPIAAMAPSLEREVREALLSAGADAVFERRADLAAYRDEAAAIVRFWARHRCLDAVGT